MGEMKPDFVTQSAKPMTGDQRHTWLRVCAKEMQEQGATWLRASIDDPNDPKITLVEGWIVRPKVEPAPHFQMTS